MATHTVQVSTDVYAAIWKERLDDENSVDEILRRKFGIASKASNGHGKGKASGFEDMRFGFRVEEGFEIFRVYLSTEYRARAEGGFWKLLNTSARYASLKELSDAVVGHENAWTGWFYLDASGKRRPVGDLRDPSRIKRRKSLNDIL
jgi:hypothetical protein